MYIERETVAQARWHLAEVFCRVTLTPGQADRTISILLTYLDDRSKIVTYCAAQALGALGKTSPRRSEVVAALRLLARAGKSQARAAERALSELNAAGPGDDAAP